jgi:hypothetical protein
MHELSQIILGTAIEALRVTGGTTVVFYLLKPQRTLRLCGEKQVFKFRHSRHFSSFKAFLLAN